MNIKTLCLTGALLLTGISIYAQKKKEVINDSNTPLHLLQPAYNCLLYTSPSPRD